MCMLLLMHKHTAIVPDNDNYCLHVVTLFNDLSSYLSAFVQTSYLPESFTMQIIPQIILGVESIYPRDGIYRQKVYGIQFNHFYSLLVKLFIAG